MDGYSEYTQMEVHKYIFSQTHATFPSTFYVALSTSNFNPDGSGIAEPTVGSYARKDAAATIFSAPTTDPTTFVTSTQNDSDITFVESTAVWGLISDFGVFSAVTGGDLIFGGGLDTSKTIETATIAVFSAGDLILSTDNTP